LNGRSAPLPAVTLQARDLASLVRECPEIAKGAALAAWISDLDLPPELAAWTCIASSGRDKVRSLEFRRIGNSPQMPSLEAVKSEKPASRQDVCVAYPSSERLSTITLDRHSPSIHRRSAPDGVFGGATMMASPRACIHRQSVPTLRECTTFKKRYFRRATPDGLVFPFQ